VVAIAAGVSHSLALTTDVPYYPPPPILVTNVRNVLRLTLTGTAGQTYGIECRDTLNPAAWQPLDSVTLISSPQRYYDETAFGGSNRFYRLVSATGASSSLMATSVPRLTIEAEVGESYQLEYRNAASRLTNWTFLTLISITNNPQVHYDEFGINAPARECRLILNNNP